MSSYPSYQAAVLTGIRGSGKTVAMTGIANRLRKEKDWIVVDLNPERDLLQMLASELCNIPKYNSIFSNAKIDLSFLGFGISIGEHSPMVDIVSTLDTLLSVLSDKKIKLLITIDEVTSSRQMREFAAQFQIFIRKEYPIFLLMTGLYQNVSDLQNEKTLTFLYRVPKFEIGPLNTIVIAERYKKAFQISDTEATNMAKTTAGYAYAFQLLGYLCSKKKLPYSEVLPDFDAGLEQYVYEKIWCELSEKDQFVLFAIASASGTKVEQIREKAEMDSATFSVYRNRLLKQGIIKATKYGHLDFCLPRFREFVLRIGN